MADGRGEVDEREIIKPPLRSSVRKHFGFCKDGNFLNKSLAVCRICKGQVKYNGNTTNLSNPLHLLNESSSRFSHCSFNLKKCWLILYLYFYVEKQQQKLQVNLLLIQPEEMLVALYFDINIIIFLCWKTKAEVAGKPTVEMLVALTVLYWKCIEYWKWEQKRLTSC